MTELEHEHTCPICREDRDCSMMHCRALAFVDRGSPLRAPSSGLAKLLALSPLPDPLRPEVIEGLSDLLLSAIQRDPDAFRADPEGGTTVTPLEAS